MTETLNFEDLPKKQQQLITTATELFYSYGVRRVTINEICRKASVSPMTFYKYFSNKWDIAKTVLDIMLDEATRLSQSMLEDNISFTQKVEKMFMAAAAQAQAYSSDLRDDLMSEDSPLRSYTLKRRKKFVELHTNFLKKAQKDGYIHSDIKIPFLLFIWNRYCNLLDHPEFVQIMPDVEDRANELAVLFSRGFTKTP
jgi:AcrR family transcriptional regulator